MNGLSQASERVEADESTQRLIAEMDRWAGKACHDCTATLIAHHVLASSFMGAKDAPLCLDCLAKRMNEQVDEFRERLVPFLLRRPCYAEAWEIANGREGVSSLPTPNLPTLPHPIIPAYNGPIADTWDAGELGCGDLVLQLRIRLQRMTAGTALRVIALDPGAPEDLPAWCRMTRHALLAAQHPEYIIQRKEG